MTSVLRETITWHRVDAGQLPDAVRERGIPYAAPMVRAVLAGTKSQTRRQINPQPAGQLVARCPYGVPGDRLWVREAWRALAAFDARAPRHIERGNAIHYEADGDLSGKRDAGLNGWGRYRHARFMPRWASRIVLEITEIRAQRLQAITALDSLEEGLQECHDLPYRFDHPVCLQTAVRLYRELWEQLHGAGSWDANPWVWAISFRRITP